MTLTNQQNKDMEEDDGVSGVFRKLASHDKIIMCKTLN